MPAAEKRVWTSDDVRRLRDEQRAPSFEEWRRYEVVDGELLVTPAPRLLHQRAVMRLGVALHAYVEPRRFGMVLANATDVELDSRTNVQPDVSVAPRTAGRLPREWREYRDLLLVAEVLSPGTARYDRGAKRVRYQRAGIPEYWIVDLDGRVVERWRPEDERPEILTETLVWHPAGADDGLTVDLAAFFAEVWDEG